MRSRVIVELGDYEIGVLDALVKGGVGESRAGALVWCVRHFSQKEADWPENFRKLFSVDNTLTDDQREEKRIIHRVATRVGKRLDALALNTPSGALRTLLVDASLVIDIYRNGSLQSVARRLEAAARERDLLG